jgi:hypothetical protein
MALWRSLRLATIVEVGCTLDCVYQDDAVVTRNPIDPYPVGNVVLTT